MLVVSANWSFGDGSLVAAAAAPFAGIWLQAVQRAAVRAGFGRDGNYRPIDGLQVVLAGDTFDCLTSATWTGRVRPWHGGRAAAAARRSMLVRATGRGRRLLRGLSRWARNGLLVPTADHRGRPVLGATVRVPVQVALLAGDRDSWLDEAADAAATYGLSIGHVWSAGATEVRHGHEGDPCAAAGDGRRTGSRGWQPTLGESVAVDLVARFAAAVATTAAAPACRPLLTALAATGPLDLPAVFSHWLEARRFRAASVPEHRDVVLTQWRRSVHAWQRETTRQPPVSPVGFAACDALAGLFDAVGRGLPGGHDVGDLLAARPGAASRGSLALGHPPTAAAPESGPPRVICLGASATARWSEVGAAADMPRTCGPPLTVLHREDDWQRLPIHGLADDQPLMSASIPSPIIDAA